MRSRSIVLIWIVLFWAAIGRGDVEQGDAPLRHGIRAATVIEFAAFSNIVKPWIVIQSAPISLKMASFKLPAVWSAAAVTVLPLP